MLLKIDSHTIVKEKDCHKGAFIRQKNFAGESHRHWTALDCLNEHSTLPTTLFKTHTVDVIKSNQIFI